MSTPNFTALLDQIWAWPVDSLGALPALSAAQNIALGTNPPYTVQDFLAFYPKFGGVTLQTSATTTLDSADVTVVNAAGLAVGNPVSGIGIPDGASIKSIAGTVVTLTAPATASGTVIIAVWNLPLIPISVLNAYIYLASASLVQARWQEQWKMAMALFVAHYATLYAKSDGDANSTVGQAASQGLSSGIQVAKSVGDVSVTYQPIQGLENWGAWNLTSYGQALATLAKVVGAGPMLLW